MVKVKNKVLIALSILLCAVLFSGVFMFTNNTKSLNAETETQSQNKTTAQDEIKVMATGTDVNFPVSWALQVAKMKGETGSDDSEIQRNYEYKINSILFTQSVPEEYKTLGTLDTELSVYDQEVTITNEDGTSEVKYNLAFVNENGRIVAPENSSKLFGGDIPASVLNEDETLNEVRHMFSLSITSIIFDSYLVNENGTQVRKSVFDTSNVTNMASMFCAGYSSGYANNFTISGLEYWDTSKVRNMSGMFYSCAQSHNFTVDVSHFDTSNVTIMANMFGGCRLITSLDVSNFDTSKVTNMSGMFTVGLETLDVSNFDTSNVTNMSNMFYSCANVKSLNIGNFNTSKVTNMSYMFSGCTNLTGLVFPSTFDTSSVTDMSYMFQNCSSLKNIDLSSFDTSSLTTIVQMFDGCSSLKSIDLSKINYDSINSMLGLALMFKDCTSLTSINLGASNIEVSIMGVCYGCTNLKTIDLSGLAGATMSAMDFTNCKSLTKIKLPQSITITNAQMPPSLPEISNLTVENADHYGYVGDNGEVVSITTDGGATTITSDMAGKTIELYDSNNNSLVVVAPVEPATGVNASVIALIISAVVLLSVATYVVVSNKKRKVR